MRVPQLKFPSTFVEHSRSATVQLDEVEHRRICELMPNLPAEVKRTWSCDSVVVSMAAMTSTLADGFEFDFHELMVKVPFEWRDQPALFPAVTLVDDQLSWARGWLMGFEKHLIADTAFKSQWRCGSESHRLAVDLDGELVLADDSNPDSLHARPLVVFRDFDLGQGIRSTGGWKFVPSTFEITKLSRVDSSRKRMAVVIDGTAIGQVSSMTERRCSFTMSSPELLPETARQ